MMSDHPVYRALLAALAVPYSVFILWCIIDAVRRSVKGDRGDE